MDANTADRSYNAIRHLLQSPGWDWLKHQIQHRQKEVVQHLLNDLPEKETTQLREEHRTLDFILNLPLQQKAILADLITAQNSEANSDDH